MAPVGKKNSGRDARRSRSRNTTPTSAVSSAVEPSSTSNGPYLQTILRPANAPPGLTLEDLLDQYGSVANIPNSSGLIEAQETVKAQLSSHQKVRGEVFDRLMRELARRRKERIEQERDAEAAERQAEERRLRLKKSKKREPEEERPPAVGAHGLARQDGVDVHKDNASILSSPMSQPPPSATEARPGTMDSATSPTASESSHQPRPAPTVPHVQSFGPDPSKFPDSTIYHIREITPDMSETEKKKIFGVSSYPQDDLTHMTAGEAPDKDFSNAKPSNQVTASAFANMVEPYIRPLTEEDVAFLKERGDRFTPFVMPRRGPRHYKEIWADEDGSMALDTSADKLPPNEPRGDIEDMHEGVEETNTVSVGPLTSRLLSAMRTEGGRPSANNANDSSLLNGLPNGDHMDLDNPEAQFQANGDMPLPSIPATFMNESTNPTWKNATPIHHDYASLDDRVMQELRHIGFLAPDDAPDYDGHYDDEVAARLRYLQTELRHQMIVNGARKARILELTSERMAQQEYNQIADDLDSQINQAYLKRNRNIGKSKKQQKRPGGPGGGSHPVPGVAVKAQGVVGEQIVKLMDRKRNWESLIGPVAEYGKATVPKETVFEHERIKELMAKEQEAWDAHVEAEG